MGGPFVWFDLTAVGDADRVRSFYTELFRWTASPAAGDYQSWFTATDQPWAGVLTAARDTAGRWIPYVMVDDPDAAAERALALGGSVVREKTTGPAGAAVLVADPGGAIIALFTPSAG
jgi:predicted enzyme related to lactoylglutathione lyase